LEEPQAVAQIHEEDPHLPENLSKVKDPIANRGGVSQDKFYKSSRDLMQLNFNWMFSCYW